MKCNECNAYIIQTYYHCEVCKNFDLCLDCYGIGKFPSWYLLLYVLLLLSIFVLFNLLYFTMIVVIFFTAWKVSKYGVISGPYFPVIGLNTDQK